MKKKANVPKKPAASEAKPTYKSFVPAENIVHHTHTAGSKYGPDYYVFSWKNVLLSALAFGIIAQVLHTIDAILTMGFYIDPLYFPLWSRVMMPGPGAPPAEFFILSFLASVLTGFILAYAYALVRSGIRQSSYLRSGIFYGSMIFMITLPGFISMYLLLALPALLIIDWAAWSFVISLVGCTAITKIMG